MDIDLAAKALKELGHPTRLALFRKVVKAGYQGIAVGGLQASLDVPGSTLSHHVAGLVSAGLIKQRREGRVLFCVAEYDRLQAVIGFLVNECCLDEAAESDISPLT